MRKSILVIFLLVLFIGRLDSQNLEQDQTPSEWINECFQEKLNNWKRRKESERRIDYKKRMSPAIINKVKKTLRDECLEWFIYDATKNQTVTYEYKEDVHKLQLHFDDFESIEVNVHPSIANRLINNSKELTYCKLKFELIDDKIIIRRMVINDPIKNIAYCYGFNPETTNEKLAGRVVESIGNIVIEDSILTIKVWDDQRVDGDSIALYLNEQLILENFPLRKEKKVLSISSSSKENILTLHALNLGAIPPSTASLEINGKKVELSSDLTNSQAIIITNKSNDSQELIPFEGQEKYCQKCFKSKPKYTISMTEIDDIAKCYINGVEVAKSIYGKKGINGQWTTSEWRGVSGVIDITDHIKKGINEIRFTLENEHCCATSFQYELKKGTEIILKDAIEKATGQSQKGVVWDKKYQLEW